MLCTYDELHINGCDRGLVHGNGVLVYGPLSSSPGDTYKVANPKPIQPDMFSKCTMYHRVSSKKVWWVDQGSTQASKQVCIQLYSPIHFLCQVSENT